MLRFIDGRLVTAFKLLMIAVPVLALVVMAGSWLRYGIDMPWTDDWGALKREAVGSFAIADLFYPARHTQYPFGRFMEAVAFHTLSYNTVAYQFLTMTIVLGGILVCQWKLLAMCVEDRVVRYAAFGLTVFIFQPGSYWGVQNIAYHQALPIFFMMIALTVAMSDGVWKWARFAVPAVLATLGGLSYISGAFAALSAMVGLGAFAYHQRRYLLPALGMAVATAITMPLQLGYVISQGSEVTPNDTMLPPWSGDYWLFFAGKVARALMLHTANVYVALAITVAVIALTASAAILAFRDAFRPLGSDTSVARFNVVMSTLAGVVFVYLMVVAAGRAGIIVGRGPLYSRIPSFANGYTRFHFFWVTVLFPWVFAYWAIVIPARFRSASAIVASCIIAVALWAGVADNPTTFQRRGKDMQAKGVYCIQERLLANEPVVCPHLSRTDLAPALVYGRANNLSYMRHFSPALFSLPAK